MGTLLSALSGAGGGSSPFSGVSPAIAGNPISPLFNKLTTPNAQTGLDPIAAQGQQLMKGMGLPGAVAPGAQQGQAGAQQQPQAQMPQLPKPAEFPLMVQAPDSAGGGMSPQSLAILQQLFPRR